MNSLHAFVAMCSNLVHLLTTALHLSTHIDVYIHICVRMYVLRSMCVLFFGCLLNPSYFIFDFNHAMKSSHVHVAATCNNDVYMEPHIHTHIDTYIHCYLPLVCMHAMLPAPQLRITLAVARKVATSQRSTAMDFECFWRKW